MCCTTQSSRRRTLLKSLSERSQLTTAIALLSHPDGFWAFRNYLESEFHSQEIFFWKAATDYKYVRIINPLSTHMSICTCLLCVVLFSPFLLMLPLLF